MQRLKLFLKSYSEEVDPSTKVVLFSHSCAISALFAQGVDPVSHQFIGNRRFENCEIVPFSFSEN